MYSLPTTVIVNDREFHIRNSGDYRIVLDCFSALRDDELSEDYRVLASLIIFYEEFYSIEDIQNYKEYLSGLVKEQGKFINCGQDESMGYKTHHAVMDWEKDSQLICAGINPQIQKDVRAVEYMHWWTFLGYYLSIGDSVFATVVSIRNKLVNHQKLEKWEQKFKNNNPKYFIWRHQSTEEIEMENYIRNLLNKKE